jgi:ABC-type amino acid transport substrate-binding protein
VKVKHIFTLLVSYVILIYATGCSQVSDKTQLETELFKTYHDIPGITAQEISAIEAIKENYDTFSFGIIQSTEAFLTEKGTIDGYSAYFCEWLTGLFGIRFQPEIYSWNDVIEKLDTGQIDFAGNITPTEERRQRYYMTDPIAERQYKTVNIIGTSVLDRIALTRPLRFAFIESAAIADNVASVTGVDIYEPVYVNNYADAYRALLSGVADAYIGDNAGVSSFDAYGDVYINDFTPLIFSPVSTATSRADLGSIITVVTKALRGGAMPYLNNLYNRGYEAYKKNKLFIQLSDEEKKYLENPSPVLLAARYFNYPIDFYNTHDNKGDGLAFDVLREVEKLTGLTFTVVNDKNTKLSELYEMVRVGKAQIVSELLI